MAFWEVHEKRKLRILGTGMHGFSLGLRLSLPACMLEFLWHCKNENPLFGLPGGIPFLFTSSPFPLTCEFLFQSCVLKIDSFYLDVGCQGLGWDVIVFMSDDQVQYWYRDRVSIFIC